MNQASALPSVSIAIPVYKHLPFLEACLMSVLNQSYDNLEVVIVDDCSPDGSADWVQQFIQSPQWQSRFGDRTQFYPFSTNQGAHVAINYAIRQTHGQYITILNSDDMYHPHRIERLVTTLAKSERDLIFSGVQYVDAQGQLAVNDMVQRFLKMQQEIHTFPSVGFACLAANVAISTGNFLFSRTLWQQVGEFASYRYCHDWDFLLRAIAFTEPVYLPENLYSYRFHGKNSFESLQSVALTETDQIVGQYIKNMRYRLTRNAIAPSPLNWPCVFELFLHWQGFDRFASPQL
jgi:glycosyltransferase involved in cell wall biosynthesis